MKNFTGLHKKFIAGIGSGIFLFFSLPCISFAEETVQTVNSPAQSIANQTTAENSSTSVQPVEISTQAATTISAPPVYAPVNAAQSVTPTKTNSASQLANVIGGLAVILVLIYGLSWFVKRFAQGGFTQNPGMKIISSMPLGTRERLMLVDVGGKQLLLGVTATQINSLHVFDEPVMVPEKTQPVASEFSQKLMAIIQKNHTSDVNAQKNSNS